MDPGVADLMCNNEEKELLRKELLWLGYGALIPGMLGASLRRPAIVG